MKGLAPGKVILTGEHAVVYGRPALVGAVRLFAETTVRRDPAQVFTLELADFRQRHGFLWEDLQVLRRELRARHEEYLRGARGVAEILSGPADLLAFALAELLEVAGGPPDAGLFLRVQSALPVGCGMGSSAATVLSLLRAVSAALGLPLSVERLFSLALEAEKLQHGRPSGVDPYVCLHGGLVRFRAGHGEKRPWPRNARLDLVNTGTPRSTTGECVDHVARTVGESPVWDAFEQVAADMEEALARQDARALVEHVRRNHRLLVELGVVPEKVREFVARVEKAGGAAKVCGAGTVRGDAAGLLWVVHPSPPLEIARDFGYEWMTVLGEEGGARLG